MQISFVSPLVCPHTHTHTQHTHTHTHTNTHTNIIYVYRTHRDCPPRPAREPWRSTSVWFSRLIACLIGLPRQGCFDNNFKSNLKTKNCNVLSKSFESCRRGRHGQNISHLFGFFLVLALFLDRHNRSTGSEQVRNILSLPPHLCRPPL